MATFTPPESELKALFPSVRSLTYLDSGGFKTVYKASIGAGLEALKVVCLPEVPLPEQQPLKEECLARIEREIRFLERCKAPEIVKLGSIRPTKATLNGRECLIYSEELLNGSDLNRVIQKNSKPEESELRTLSRSLLRAIKQIWALPAVHRDIKPSNLIKLADPRRPFVLLDFGIAFALSEPSLTPEFRLPPATLAYMAPELVNPNYRREIDYRADLYAAALTVYHYATLKHPIVSAIDDERALIVKAIHQPAPPLSSVRPDLSATLCTFVDQTLKKKPALRPGDLDHLLTQMETR